MWCLGDLVGYGADPLGCLQTVTAGAERCLAGNHDLGAAGRIPVDDFSGLAGTALAWTRRALGRHGLERLARLQPSDPAGPAALFHASPRDPIWEYVVATGQARIALEAARAPLTLVGHTHQPAAWGLREDGSIETVPVAGEMLLAVGAGRWLVNPGSVGQPRDGDPRAAWALYDPDDAVIHFRRTPYDVAAAQNAILDAGLPVALASRLSEGW
jgi:diadenosine tetraphosphatase ApaH/serine/threonine PP2A family protein phosphatase